MAAIVKSFDKVSGRFACVWGGIRTSERSHDWSEEAAAVVSKNPEDVTEWLRLADRLDDEGNPAAHIIRAAFVDGYAPPVGFTGQLHRGGRYMESGQHYSEGVTIRWEWERRDGEDAADAGFVFHYWSNGGCRRAVGVEEVRSLLAGKGRRATWCDVIVEGETAPVSRVIPAGTTVQVFRPNPKGGVPKLVDAYHATKSDVPVPAGVRSHYMAANNGSGTVLVANFEHMGYIVRVATSAVAVC